MKSATSLRRRAIILGGAMAATSVGAMLVTPKPQVTSREQIPDLESMVPKTFADWVIDPSVLPMTLSPDVARTLSEIYDRTLSRTYVNRQGERVMLSIAYGANQTRALQLHKPEVCYAASGFRISEMNLGQWDIGKIKVPTMQLLAVQGRRSEPITYWMRIGDDIARGWYEQNLVRLKYGTRRQIPDGVLFRVSNISNDLAASYEVQRRFVEELLAAVGPGTQAMFVGSVALHGGG